MDTQDIESLLAEKKKRRWAMARLPIEQKIKLLIQLQQMAEPILRQRGRKVRPWSLTSPSSS